MRNIPSNYPNPYIPSNVMGKNGNYNPTTNKYIINGIHLICWLRTPTGRLSKFYGWNVKTGHEDFEVMLEDRKVALIDYMKSTYKTELKKGYTLDEVFIYQGFKKD